MGSQRRGQGEQGRLPIKLASCNLQSLILTWKCFWSAFRLLPPPGPPCLWAQHPLSPLHSSAFKVMDTGGWRGGGRKWVALLLSASSSCLSGQTEVLTPLPFLVAEDQLLYWELTWCLCFKGIFSPALTAAAPSFSLFPPLLLSSPAPSSSPPTPLAPRPCPSSLASYTVFPVLSFYALEQITDTASLPSKQSLSSF